MKTRKITSILMLTTMLSVTVYAKSLSRGAQRSSKRVTSETATTKSGRTVILRSDGTWVYSDETRPSGSSTAEPVETVATAAPIRSSLKEVMTDKIGFKNKKVLIANPYTATSIEIPTLPDYCESETHFSFQIFDGTGIGKVQMKRSSASELRKRLLRDGIAYGSFIVSLLKKKPEIGCADLELLDYKLR